MTSTSPFTQPRTRTRSTYPNRRYTRISYLTLSVDCAMRTPPHSLAVLQAIRDETFADDLPIDYDTMCLWTEERVCAFFESGGKDPEAPAPPAPSPPAAPPPKSPGAEPSPPRPEPAVASHRVSGSMYGMRLANCERLAEQVVVVRGLNPGFFTGPGTNTCGLVDSNRRCWTQDADHMLTVVAILVRQTLWAVGVSAFSSTPETMVGPTISTCLVARCRPFAVVHG